MITYRITTLFIPLQQTMYVVWVEIVFAHSSAPKESKQIVEKNKLSLYKFIYFIPSNQIVEVLHNFSKTRLSNNFHGQCHNSFEILS